MPFFSMMLYQRLMGSKTNTHEQHKVLPLISIQMQMSPKLRFVIIAYLAPPLSNDTAAESVTHAYTHQYGVSLVVLDTHTNASVLFDHPWINPTVLLWTFFIFNHFGCDYVNICYCDYWQYKTLFKFFFFRSLADTIVP